MDKLVEINQMLQKGRAKAVVKLVQEAIEEGIEADLILREALLKGMNEVNIGLGNYLNGTFHLIFKDLNK